MTLMTSAGDWRTVVPSAPSADFTDGGSFDVKLLVGDAKGEDFECLTVHLSNKNVTSELHPVLVGDRNVSVEGAR